ncbi:MAG: DUF4082 domain-containing protein [Isosphaeraceae bacterium]|nr:DUF4082 domain-containing protein [Isosphaeraceae bacterium]
MIRHPDRPRPVSKRRRLVPTVFLLEARELLSTTAAVGPVSATSLTAHPMFDLGSLAASGTPPAGALTPAQIAQAYGFNAIAFGSVKGTGAGETIAIVDAYDDPNIQADLNAFDTQFGLPSTTVARVNENGGSSLPGTDSTGGWEMEEALDVEWAHAVAPGASILLVEASSANDTDLLNAVGYAAAHANVVSMSWGGSEFSGENAYDANFSKTGVVFVASSGDSGAPASWPATSPNVVSVGGTALTLGANSSWLSESGWSGSTGGPSAYETQPNYQKGIVTQTTTKRANPDVAYDASPSTGVAVYDSFPYQRITYGWLTVGGTSAGSPQWSALLAIADQGRALSSQSALNAAGPQGVLTTLYQNATTGDFHDITTGTSTGNPHYSAGPGYDYVTGLGSPVANLVVQSLDGNLTNPNPSDNLVLNAPTAVTAGTSFNVTVTAQNSSGATDTGYAGTVKFTSSDVQAGLPASFTFTAADDGTYTFPVTLKTAGSQSVTVTDTASGHFATQSGITVSPAAATQLTLIGLPTTATVGAPVTFTVTAMDPYGNLATGYTGPVNVTSSDTQAVLPTGSQTLTGGSRTFTVAFGTAGVQSVTVNGSAGLSATQSGITVSPAAPTNLTATAVSSSQINLSWTAAAGGATGYLVQSSLNGSTWTQLGTTAAGVTTYQVTGLAAGTTYEFRVQATGASTGSAYSNTAFATTTGGSTGSSTGDTLWSNSYTPSENAYSYGAYDLGVKFTANVSGTVTGARFYKQTWMNGYTHVGYLWSSTGVLLASAQFTNETAYGWEQVNFSSPVAISANTVYIVSFSSGSGYFGVTTSYFSRSGIQSGPLQALGNGVSGGNGVYGSGNSAFPNASGAGMNFWADVVFSPSSSSSSASTQTRAIGSSYVVVTPADSKVGSSLISISSPWAQKSVQQEAAAIPGTWAYHIAVPQVSTRPQGFFSLGGVS